MPNAYQQHLLCQAEHAPVFRRLVEKNLEPGEFARFLNLAGSARALVAAGLQQKFGRPVLVVAPDAESAEIWHDDFQQFGPDGLLFFPMTETLPYEAEEPTIEIAARQFSTLYYLSRGEKADCVQRPPDRENGRPAHPPPLIVAPIEALQRKIPSPRAFEKLFLTLWWGEPLDTEKVSRRLVKMGYERQAMAETRGEFSLRGNILDIFPPHFENPVRFDLFGNEIESIRFFDPATQRSLRPVQELERVTILPAAAQSVVDRLARENPPRTEEPLLISLADWLPDETIAILDSPEKFETMLNRMDRIVVNRYRELTGTSDSKPVDFSQSKTGPGTGAPPPGVFFLDRAGVQNALERFAQIHLPQIPVKTAAGETDYDFGVQAYDTIPPDLNAYLSLIKAKQAQDYSIHVICDNDGQVMRLEELMRENDVDSRSLRAVQSAESPFTRRDLLAGYQEITLTTGPMHTGFIFPAARLLMVTDREMFGRYKRRHVYRKAYKGRAVLSASDVQRQDFVVHADHGIGRFLGIRKQEIDGRLTELLEIEYAEDNKLLVPIEHVHRIQKYSSTEGAAPALDRLGGKRWQKRKKRSQEQIESMARELLEIYAKRETAPGHAFNADSVWQTEFEESFIYEETPDQARAIAEIKKDMTASRPMDRLLCGDVGFGKTEVAMRAAFKCLEDKKQVAVLVPTTILAQQHYTTFTERFADYPFQVEVMSRFRTDAEQRDIIQRLKAGSIGIVIGTHRLLSKDMRFADLGLLIVDEEHRFGVAQKEKIKALRAAVDILTLSATPIPRTLHLALGGLRDMSAINTPPRDRLPIRTRVIHFSPREIEEAVMREINRGGQIYFVHNRVENIARVAQRLAEIAPQARVAVAHGQMHERELEKVMLEFIDRKHDILLATTIIESGLDIPNVNTIIINRADAFGLAQLYQLRGRVGRDVKRAYAYLIVPEGRPITDSAVKRLRAIEEFTELGSGFQVALRDLEIRGTGNILGPEQHGAIDSVGFELYCSMLENAVRLLQGKRGPLDEPVEIQWKISVFLPENYVPVESQRIAFYKRCAAAREIQDIENLRDELRDRYGDIPPEARHLLDISRMRLLAAQASLRKIAADRGGIRITPRGDLFDLLRRALPLKDRFPQIAEIGADATGAAHVKMRAWNLKTTEGTEQAIALTLQALQALAESTEG